MKLDAKQIENVVIVFIEGDLDAQNGPELAQFFKDQMADNVNLIADFSKVEFISSAGLRVLLATVKEARRQGGDLRLAATQKNVNEVLTISGFTRIIKIYKKVDEAIKSFSE
jgi:anti-sigma B factor antagonist